MRAFTIAHLFTTSFTLPHANGWRGRGGRITLMLGASGSTYGGASWVSPPDSQALRGLTLLELSQPQPKAMPSAKALPPRRRPPGGPAGAQALTLPG